MTYVVKMAVIVAGIGSMGGASKIVTRTVEAANISDAIALAQRDMITIEVVSAEKQA